MRFGCGRAGGLIGWVWGKGERGEGGASHGLMMVAVLAGGGFIGSYE